MHPLRIFCASFALLLVIPASASTPLEQQLRNGKWWQSLTQSQRWNHVVGIFDGTRLGLNLILPATRPGKNRANCFAQITSGFDEAERRYIGDLTNGNIVEGLNAFYRDYRNKRIYIADATLLVLYSIAGTPQKQIDELAETFRRAAMQSP
jgi:hypothetical protein